MISVPHGPTHIFNFSHEGSDKPFSYTLSGEGIHLRQDQGDISNIHGEQDTEDAEVQVHGQHHEDGRDGDKPVDPRVEMVLEATPLVVLGALISLGMN